MKKFEIHAKTDRRTFIKHTLAASAIASTTMIPFASAARASVSKLGIVLPKLPYPENALEPHISAKTISFHYGKHHNGYVVKTNKFIKNTVFEQTYLNDIIKKTAEKSEYTNIFNNAAQVFNHTFYWKSMSPKGGGEPAGKLAQSIKKTYGSYQNFREEFINKAGSVFGSGWTWLVVDGSDLKIIQTSNADNPLVHGQRPLLTIDVWEHAYYLDYQNRRGDYITAYLDHLVNWDFAAEHFAKE